MARIVSAIVRIASSVLELLTLKERRKERKERKERHDEPIAAADEIRHAIDDGDEAKVNQMLADADDYRRHGGGIRKAVSIALLCLTLAGGAALDSGCAAFKQEKMLVIPADRTCVKMEVDGVEGWFVPRVRFRELCAAYEAESVRMRLREEAMEAMEE